MRLEELDFELPAEQIAQAPLPDRDASRLMAITRSTGQWAHRAFTDLPELLREGDLLVVNDTRVVPARLLGRKLETGGKAELLVVRPAAAVATPQALSGPAEAVEWICLGQASKGLRPGTVLRFDAEVEATVVEAVGGGEYRVRFTAPGEVGDAMSALLDCAGRLPLPPYIDREPVGEDRERYQTVYASAPGSVAAPTAGLHFTPALLQRLEAKGVRRAAVTLDVGPGTFLPIRDGDLDRHPMHAERYVVPAATVEAIRQTRAAGGRVVAVGTTVVRTLEATTPTPGASPTEGAGETRLFIRPGFSFCQVDALVTNFHLPRSTLLLLVAAFLGLERTLAAYREAVAKGYRFFSYGDAMFIGEAR